MVDTIEVSSLAVFIMKTLRQAGFEAYMVGGSVRDLIGLPENRKPDMDYDFTTNAQPEQILALFPDSFYENVFGTVSTTAEKLLTQAGIPEEQFDAFAPELPPARVDRVIDPHQATKLHDSLKNAQGEPENHHPLRAIPNFEITTFRSDGAYSDHRRPDEVTWGQTLTEDLDRRDFTINAMALSVDDNFLSNFKLDPTQPITQLIASQFTVHDPHHGLQDLANHTIRTVGEPDRRFTEDALRMLRAIRFSVQLNSQIDEATFASIKTHAPLLAKISQERIADELLKMLASPYPAESIELLDATGLLEFVLPELLAAKGVEQGGHHTTDVWTHSLDALRECPSPDPIVRLATLLHDIGKPQTQAYQNNTITFYNHEIVGSRIVAAITRRFNLPRKDRDRIFTLVRHHMFHYQPHDTDAAIRRFMRKVGLPNVDDMLDLREADRLGSGARRTSWRLEEMKQRMIEQLHQPMDIRDLAINGHDLMQELGLQPGPQLGEILQTLFEQVLENPEINTKEQLLEYARKTVNE